MTDERMNELDDQYLKPTELIAFSKRDLFAGLAMMGLLANKRDFHTKDDANYAVRIADALCLELAKGKK